MELFLFLFRIEKVCKVNIRDPVRLILELDLRKMMREVLTAFSIAAFGVDKEKEVKIGSPRVEGFRLFHFSYNIFDWAR